MKITNILRSPKKTLTNFLAPVSTGVVLSFLVGCGSMNAYDLIGTGMQIGARTNSRLTHKQAVGADFTGALIGKMGDREFEKGLRNEDEEIDINIPDYSIGTRVHVKGDTVIWVKKSENHWLAYDAKTGEYVPFTPSTNREMYEFMNRPK